MKTIGEYQGRKVLWLENIHETNSLPEKDWLCLAIANSEPDFKVFENFVRKSISKNILEFKGHGEFGEKLHDIFDETMVEMEVIENHNSINTMTTWHTDETLANTFWESFFATCLPEKTDLDNVKIVCVDLDGKERIDELKLYLQEFEKGWLPND